MIGEKIIHDLELLPVKDTDSVSEIDRTTDDYLYFQLNEVYFEDDNEKARQQTIITANAMDKTMHSLNKEIEQSFTSGAELSKSIMMESYNKYNNALDLSSKGFYTSALRVIDEAKNLKITARSSTWRKPAPGGSKKDVQRKKKRKKRSCAPNSRTPEASEPSAEARPGEK